MYQWKIVFSNDVMGFQKSYTVEARNWRQAAGNAALALMAQHYDRADFSVVEVKRLWQVGK